MICCLAFFYFIMNKYNVLLKEVADSGSLRSVDLFFENHDDLFRIIDTMKCRGIFSCEKDCTQFAIGLKMFSDVMMRHRNDELFKDFQPAFIEFMKKLKKTIIN